MAAGKHSEAGPGAHAGVADCCRASWGSDTPGGASDNGSSGRTQVSGFSLIHTVPSTMGQSTQGHLLMLFLKKKKEFLCVSLAVLELTL